MAASAARICARAEAPATNPFYAATTPSEPAIGSGIETCEPGA